MFNKQQASLTKLLHIILGPRRGRVGSGQGTFRAFHLCPFLVRPKDLSRLRIILSHFELEYLNPMVLSTAGQFPTPCWVQFVCSFWMFCICPALIPVVSLKSLPFWSAICHFTCSFWVNLSYSPGGNMSFYVFILSCFESFSPSHNLIMNRITEPPKNTWPCPTLMCMFWHSFTNLINLFEIYFYR